MCADNQNNDQELNEELDQEVDLEQIVKQNPNYLTEEEAIALASGSPAEAVYGESEEIRQGRRTSVASSFRGEIGHAFEPGAKVMSADRELRYSLELQRDRIARRTLQYKDEMDPGKKPTNDFHNVRSWRDGHYETSWSVGYIKHKKTAERNGLKKFKKTEPQMIYETVVDVCDGEDVSEDTYCCPNCGAVSTIRELQEGCSHCGTSFQMTELYPKVSNYFFVPDPAANTDPFWKTVTKCGLRALPVTFILFSPMLWLGNSNIS